MGKVVYDMKDYAHNGLAGCVTQRTSKAMGVTVGLYNADQAGYDATCGAWVLVCEDHGEYVHVNTLRDAYYHMPTVDWCECCHSQREGEGDMAKGCTVRNGKVVAGDWVEIDPEAIGNNGLSLTRQVTGYSNHGGVMYLDLTEDVTTIVGFKHPSIAAKWCRKVDAPTSDERDPETIAAMMRVIQRWQDKAGESDKARVGGMAHLLRLYAAADGVGELVDGPDGARLLKLPDGRTV